jgi:hypothetical protein
MPSTRFDPHTHGFHFTNDFVVSANRIGPLPDIKFGGLCGGMSYAALDYFYAHKSTPRDDFSPFVGSTLEAYIFERQQQSIVKSPANLARWTELTVNPFGARNDEFYRWAIGERFDELRARIDDGKPVPLGLKGGDNYGDHQVVAIGYEMGRYRGDKGAHQEDIRILIYDPNYPNETTTLITDERNRKIIRSNGVGRWQGYFVDPEYRAVRPPDLGLPTSYPRDGWVHEVLLEIRTGGDDLRGQNDNCHAEIVRKDGNVQVAHNINGLQRWLDGSTQCVSIKLERPVRRDQLEAIRLRTTFGGGAFGDNWNIDRLRIRVLEDNELHQVYAREGAPLVRFDGNNTPFTAQLAAGRTVALAAANGQFVCAERGGGGEVVANRAALGPWETFSMNTTADGKVSLRCADGHFLCAEGGGGRELVANRTSPGPWETFHLARHEHGRVSLRAANGQFVCAEGGGGQALVANRSTVGAWELFELRTLD